MRLLLVTILSLIMLFSLASCGAKPTNTTTPDKPSTILSEDTNSTTNPKEDDNMSKTLELKIDNQIIDVTWLDNPSVNSLKELAKDGLTINMHEYGGF